MPKVTIEIMDAPEGAEHALEVNAVFEPKYDPKSGVPPTEGQLVGIAIINMMQGAIREFGGSVEMKD